MISKIRVLACMTGLLSGLALTNVLASTPGERTSAKAPSCTQPSPTGPKKGCASGQSCVRGQCVPIKGGEPGMPQPPRKQ